MQKRTRCILAAVLALAVVAFVVIGPWPEPPGVSQANFDRIEDGMTLKQVEAILGGPPEFNYLEKRFFWRCPSGEWASVGISKERGVMWKYWPEADETIGRTVYRWFYPQSPDPEDTGVNTL